jgi:hypothetical protein
MASQNRPRPVVQNCNLYYNETMGATIQVRLDEKSEAALKRLVRAKGCTPSQAVRESILKDDEQLRAKPRPRLIGIGCVSFGPGDLATNEKRMEGFGQKWRVDKQGNGRWDW